MKASIPWLPIAMGVALTFALASAQAAVFCVDSIAGKDTNSGREAAPWKTLARVNGKVFQPGDRILFRSGGSWTGQLNPKGSGIDGKPIIIDRYGSGPKPVINAGQAVGWGAVYLFNQEYWEINNLEIMSDAPEAGDRRGVYLSASNYIGGVVDHLYVRNCHIHHIKGLVHQTSDSAKRTGGVILEVIDDTPTPTRFNDIRIENCVISTVDNIGIALNNKVSVGDYPGTPAWEARKFTKVLIRGNSINDVAKNAMIIRMTDETGLIERNICWDTAYRAFSGNTIFSRSARGTIFQYNEGYLNRAGELDPTRAADGSLYDADLQSPGCIFQYSYSHDNAHGLYWQCTDAADTNVIVRYNISQNDKGIIFCMNYDAASTYVYNNTVFIGKHRSPRIIDERRKGVKTYWFYNNVIYNNSPTAAYNWFNANRTFHGNVFYGEHPSGEPADPAKLTLDPLLLSPGTGAIGLRTLAGYKLQPGSPCIDSGFSVPNNGGQDFWRRAVPFNSLPDRGAHEWSHDSTHLPAMRRATIRDGVSANANIDEQSAGYILVKHHTNGLSAKGYFAFDLAGANVDPDAPAAFHVARTASSGAHRIQLWALDQAYPEMSNDITWSTAQANEISGNGLATAGSLTATPFEDSIIDDGPGMSSFTLSPPWNRFSHENQLVLALTGVQDAGNSQGGFRIAVTNAAQWPALTFVRLEASAPVQIVKCEFLENQVLRLVFKAEPSGAFSVVSSESLFIPIREWEPRGLATETSEGIYEFSEFQPIEVAQRFYAVRSS
jgi:hypothetical protein